MSKELDKYEYLADEDLGIKPGVIEQARHNYSPLSESLKEVLKKVFKKR